MTSIRSESESTFNRAAIILSSIGKPSSLQRSITSETAMAVFRQVGFMTERMISSNCCSVTDGGSCTSLHVSSQTYVSGSRSDFAGARSGY